MEITRLPNHPITQDSFRLVDGERGAAPAGRRRLRILDGEAAARDGVDEVDFGARQVADADRVDEQLDAVRLEHHVARALPVFLDHQSVLEPGAAATLHEYAKAAAGLVLFGQQLVNLRRRRFGYVDHQYLSNPSGLPPIIAVRALRPRRSPPSDRDPRLSRTPL